jgi:hypothetical protein
MSLHKFAGCGARHMQPDLWTDRPLAVRLDQRLAANFRREPGARSPWNREVISE